ncbi:tetratricopeptide repeat protein [Enterococcus sp. BWB1-3]|uniref:tetratricopeptide repeat protein n=1 Tax=unclassified Enterococcus TaxID=2608891 RepID=UPI001920A709|nr:MULTISPECIES: tetratricopeptide repeat protein [unclassified Enterococcus]MBL1228246.1 tetratricopeptide repeat protein [Enterococcus sp. BWB1-3]MCB5951470.1 tetratricopeptide repeat protein [Enterococcus sp. BWT-B8]MCB5955029.1 tetratricopeptide repeat protein [Enterococcus sp. CWB-B31]
MFGLFKKKEKKEPEKEVEVLSPEAAEKIRSEINRLNQEISTTQDNNKLAELFEQVGLKLSDLNEKDQAIEQLEKSLENKKSIGDGYKKLMSLYNEKRAEAARAGDDQGIDYYMGKMDEMRQIAKQVTISGNQ